MPIIENTIQVSDVTELILFHDVAVVVNAERLRVLETLDAQVVVFPLLGEAAHNLVVRDMYVPGSIKLLPHAIKLLFLVVSETRERPFGPTAWVLS